MVQRHCETEFSRARKINMAMLNYLQGFDLINCTKLPRRNGGTIPECYFPKELQGKVSFKMLCIIVHP